MKVAVACKSLLLQKSLELFLKDYLSSYKYCDFLVSDRKIKIDKPLFLISKDKEANIKIPFTKSQLILEVKAFYKNLYKDDIFDGKKAKDFKSLERKIERLCENFKKDLIKIVREHYER